MKPTLQLDQSTTWHGLHFNRDGKTISMEEAFKDGFYVNQNDAPAVLSLIQNFVQTRELNAQ
jgi:hypothetical protein